MTAQEALDQAAASAASGQVRFPRALQGFPGTVHGGAVAALFHRLALPRPPFRLSLALLRGVPTEALLRLTTGSAGSEARLGLEQGGRRLAEASLSREGLPPVDPEPVRALQARHGVPEGELPGTASCLACGSANPAGVGVRFLVNDRLLWRELDPPAGYRLGDGSGHPALATVLLDELGWWLGALSQHECGVTTEVLIVLLRTIPPGPLVVLGDRAAVRSDGDARGRYSRAAGYLLTPAGEAVAWGEVRFAGSRAYTRRLLGPFLETTERATIVRLFPGASELERTPE